MQFEKKYKPDVAASTDELRRALTGVLLTGKMLVSTNGHALVMIPCTPDEGEPDGVVIPAEALKKARGVKGKHPYATVTVEGNTATVTDSTNARTVLPLVEEKFPNWKSVLPEFNTPVFQVAFDMNHLQAVTKAIGAERVILTFNGAEKAFRVEPHEPGEDAGWGICMPCRISSSRAFNGVTEVTVKKEKGKVATVEYTT